MKNISKNIENQYNIKIYDIEELTGGWLNKKYLLYTSTGKFVAKIMSKEKFSKMSNNEYDENYEAKVLKNALKIENYMFDNGINCPNVLENIDKELISFFEGEYMFIMSFINGQQKNYNDVSIKQLYYLGEETARMHELFKSVDGINFSGRYLKLPTLDELKDANMRKQAENNHTNSEYSSLLKYQAEIIDFLERRNLLAEIPIGFIHGDYACDNIIFVNNIPYIIDFELVRENSHLQDIGRILLSFCFNNEIGELEIPKLESFVLGYNNISDLKESDIALSLIVVWINEFNMWVKQSYFNKDITIKAKRFQDELKYLTYNFYNIINYYEQKTNKIGKTYVKKYKGDKL